MLCLSRRKGPILFPLIPSISYFLNGKQWKFLVRNLTRDESKGMIYWSILLNLELWWSRMVEAFMNYRKCVFNTATNATCAGKSGKSIFTKLNSVVPKRKLLSSNVAERQIYGFWYLEGTHLTAKWSEICKFNYSQQINSFHWRFLSLWKDTRKASRDSTVVEETSRRRRWASLLREKRWSQSNPIRVNLISWQVPRDSAAVSCEVQLRLSSGELAFLFKFSKQSHLLKMQNKWSPPNEKLFPLKAPILFGSIINNSEW